MPTEGWTYKRKYYPPTEEELKTLERLLKASLLYKAVRGDQIEVRHLQKDRSAEFALADQQLTRERVYQRAFLVAGIALLSFFLVYLMYRAVKREVVRRRRLREEELVMQQQLMREAALQASKEGDAEVEISVDERARREMIENAISLVRENPDQVAKLLRTWLTED